ncbi:4-hydroxybenzoate polyprenyl transferase [Mycena galericulata]|nr:4-hydroxybenzoate polyprenyl transferase [Mycena galericulata]
MTNISTLIELSRINKFAGTMILFWPYAWSVTMSARQLQVPLQSYMFALLSGFFRCMHSSQVDILLASFNFPQHWELNWNSGGCVWNDIIDKDLDAKVERTKHRPLPDGRISVVQALVFLSVHVVLLFGMSRPLNSVARLFLFLTVVPFTGLYPFMKRVTYWPQAWLGITLNTPVLLAATIFTEEMSLASFALAAGGWAWTMWYDTIYGSQDKKDDAKAGVGSIVLLLHRYTRFALLIFSTSIVACWIACGILNRNGLPYFTVSVGGGSLLLARDLWTVDLDDPKSCLRAFERNGFVIGPIVWVGFLLDYLMI